MRMLWVVALVGLAGCSGKTQSEQAVQTNAVQQSTAAQVIDGMTGVSAVKAGRRAEDTIRRVSEKKNKDLDEATSGQ